MPLRSCTIPTPLGEMLAVASPAGLCLLEFVGQKGVERELEDGSVEVGSEHHDRRWIALLILSLSLMLVIMDGTIVNVAIPSITQDFNSTFRDAE